MKWFCRNLKFNPLHDRLLSFIQGLVSKIKLPEFEFTFSTSSTKDDIRIQAQKQRIIVEPLEEAFAINFGLTGPWYDPAMSGQGFYVDVVPSFNPPLVAMAWFTFDKEAGGQERQRWFTGIGPYEEGGNQVELEIFRTTGGRFVMTTPPAQTEVMGSAQLVFAGCGNATFTYDLQLGTEQLPDARTGSIELQRTTPDVLCEDLANPPEAEQ
jgi:hypothetical protein